MSKDLLVIANWKMYKTAREAAAYIEALLPLVEGLSTTLFLAVPYTSIASAAKAAKGSGIFIGAQNMNDAREGAFTGEIAALMLKEAGADFVILGHSERRHVFGETDEFIHRKVIRALQDGLVPIVCVGETREEHKAGKTESVIGHQVKACLKSVPKEEASKLIVAYEPVWAIGTGLIATPALIESAHALVRAALAELFGQRIAAKIPIVYGGSVKPENVAKIASNKEVNGVLVGGASLDPQMLAHIAKNCKKSPKGKK